MVSNRKPRGGGDVAFIFARGQGFTEKLPGMEGGTLFWILLHFYLQVF